MYESGSARLLLVEDNGINQKVALMMLKHLGYVADLAQNGREAVAAFNGSLYDAILMDCLMPEMDGFEAARQIRSSGPLGAVVPIIALTANAYPEDREACLAAGMNDYLSKPVRRELLAAKLREWLSKPKQKLCPTAPEFVNAEHRRFTTCMWALTSNLTELINEGQGDVVAELLHVFLGEAAKHIEAASTALESSDFKAVGFHAHSLKGSSAAVGAASLTNLAAELNEASDSGNLDRAQANLLALGQQFRGVRVCIEESLTQWSEHKPAC